MQQTFGFCLQAGQSKKNDVEKPNASKGAITVHLAARYTSCSAVRARVKLSTSTLMNQGFECLNGIKTWHPGKVCFTSAL